jgi:hypothetical protein
VAEERKAHGHGEEEVDALMAVSGSASGVTEADG